MVQVSLSLTARANLLPSLECIASRRLVLTQLSYACHSADQKMGRVFAFEDEFKFGVEDDGKREEYENERKPQELHDPGAHSSAKCGPRELNTDASKHDRQVLHHKGKCAGDAHAQERELGSTQWEATLVGNTYMIPVRSLRCWIRTSFRCCHHIVIFHPIAMPTVTFVCVRLRYRQKYG